MSSEKEQAQAAAKIVSQIDTSAGTALFNALPAKDKIAVMQCGFYFSRLNAGCNAETMERRLPAIKQMLDDLLTAARKREAKP